MKKSLTAICAIAAALYLTTLAVMAGGATSSYNHDGIRFIYPSPWQKVSDSQARTFGRELATDAKGVVTLGSAGGVDSVFAGGNRGVAAILTKMKFTAKYQKQLKGNEKKFVKLFLSGIRANKSAKVLSTTTVSFAGNSKATAIQADIKSGGTNSRDEFLLSLQGDKWVDMGIFVVLPPGQWMNYSAPLGYIAASSRFK